MIDYCAGCGKPLAHTPGFGRLYCCSGDYWTANVPAPSDARSFYQLTGNTVLSAAQPGKPTLHLMRAP